MRADLHFTEHLRIPARVKLGCVVVELMGFPGAAGKGHSTDGTVTPDLAGHPLGGASIDVVDTTTSDIERTGALSAAGTGEVEFAAERDVLFFPGRIPPFYVNSFTVRALAGDGATLGEYIYHSVDGGSMMRERGDAERASETRPLVAVWDCPTASPSPYPYSSAVQLLGRCEREGPRVSDVVEVSGPTPMGGEELLAALGRIVAMMRKNTEAGCTATGLLPGILKMHRRVPRLLVDLRVQRASDDGDELAGMDWINLYALAVNEENAAGHRVVTALTNGVASVTSVVLAYYIHHKGGSTECVRRFSLTTSAVGGLIKMNVSIAGVEIGCQGETRPVCAMTAAGLAEALGGQSQQMENVVEIVMKHYLGLTCDPVGGFIQIPCIERSAITAIKAINATWMALWGDGRHAVSFNVVTETMRQAGEGMLPKYKEISHGGLAVSVVEC